MNITKENYKQQVEIARNKFADICKEATRFIYSYTSGEEYVGTEQQDIEAELKVIKMFEDKFTSDELLIVANTYSKSMINEWFLQEKSKN